MHTFGNMPSFVHTIKEENMNVNIKVEDLLHLDSYLPQHGLHLVLRVGK